MTKTLLIGLIGFSVPLIVLVVLWQRRQKAAQFEAARQRAAQLEADRLKAEQEQKAREEKLRLERLKAEEEMRAFYEIARQLADNTQQALHTLQRIRTEDWPKSRAELNAAIERYTNQSHRLLGQRVEQVVDGDFFWSAAKAALPRQAWKDEFNEYIRQPEQQLVDQEGLKSDLTGLVRSSEEQFVNLLASEVQGQSGTLRLAPNANNAFARLKAKPERLREMVGESTELQTLFRSEVLPDLLKGGALIGAGLLLQDALDGEGAIELFGTVIGAALGDEALTLLVDEIKEWVIAEVGEQVFLEFAEAVAAALTVFGVVLFIWKLGKYTWLAKRLFYDQEPLQKMRANVLAEGHQALLKAGNEAKQKSEERIATLLEKTETQLKALHSAAAERAAWALLQLPAATPAV